MRPYLRAANITWNGLDLSDMKEMNFSEQESEVYEVRPGDVLVAEASGSASEVGKPALWRGEIAECCFQNTLVRVRSHGPLPEYLRYHLLAEARSGRLGDAARGVGIHHIGASRLSAWPVRVPPLSEQRRIVSAIEEHFSRLDAAEDSLRRAGRKLARLREGVAREAIRNAAPLVTQTLESICPVFVDCLHRTPQYSDHGRPALRPRDVVGGILKLDGAARVGTEEFLKQTERRLPLAGDIVYSRELSYGWAVVVPADGVLCMSQGMVLMRPNDSVSPKFLALVLNSPIGRDQAKAAAAGTAHPHINLRDIRGYRIPIPSRKQQEHIVTEVERQVSVVDALDDEIEQARRRAAALRRSILERAFRGELVPQDPSDEPASVILEGIRAERSAARPTPGRWPVRSGR